MNNGYENISFKEKFGLYSLYGVTCHKILFF